MTERMTLEVDSMDEEDNSEVDRRPKTMQNVSKAFAMGLFLLDEKGRSTNLRQMHILQ